VALHGVLNPEIHSPGPQPFRPRLLARRRIFAFDLLAIAKQPFDRGYEQLRRCTFRHVNSLVSSPVLFSGGVPAVEHVGDVPPFQVLAKLRTLAIAERVIQDDS
jgi:hypothetical protein